MRIATAQCGEHRRRASSGVDNASVANALGACALLAFLAACNPGRTIGDTLVEDALDTSPLNQGETSGNADAASGDAWFDAADDLRSPTDAIVPDAAADGTAYDVDQDVRNEDATDVMDLDFGDADASDVDEPIRPPTCNASEFPEFRAPSAIDAQSDQLVWVLVGRDTQPTLVSRFEGRLSAYDVESGTFVAVAAEHPVANIAAVGSAPSTGANVVAQVVGSAEHRLFELQRSDGTLSLVGLDTPSSIAAASEFAFHDDGRLVTRDESALRIFEPGADPVLETACAAEPGVGPLLIHSESDAIFSYLPVNSLGDVVFARWSLSDCDQAPAQGDIPFNGANASVLLRSDAGPVAVTLSATFSATTFDGLRSGAIDFDTSFRAPTDGPRTLDAVRRTSREQDQMLVDGALLVDVLGDRGLRWLVGGSPAVGSSGVAFSVVTTATGLLWRDRDWQQAGEPLPLPERAARMSWLEEPGGATFLVRELDVAGFASGATLTVSAARVGPSRAMETRTFAAGGILRYKDVLWSSGPRRVGWSAGGDVVWLSGDGEPQLPPDEFRSEGSIFLAGAWLNSVGQGGTYRGITPTVIGQSGPADNALPAGLHWRRSTAEGGTSTFRGTLGSPVTERHFLRDAVSERVYLIARQDGVLRLYEVHDSEMLPLDAPEALADSEAAEVRVLGLPESGEFLLARSDRIEVYRMEDGVLALRASDLSEAPLRVISDASYTRYGVLLASEENDAWLWTPTANAARSLDLADVEGGSVGDMDQDGVIDVVVRHTGARDDLLYYGDCW